MVLGLDYDDTYTRDPSAWTNFIAMMDSAGHDVYLVTWRTPSEAAAMFLTPIARKYLRGIYPTSRKAKAKFMAEQGIIVDVWIDDNPSAILYTMEGWGWTSG